MIKGTDKYYYSRDGLGSVVNLTNPTGQVTESYTYDEYGSPNTASQAGNRYMFTGREYDTETGLYYYRARYYDPSIGRFLQTDPIGYEGVKGEGVKSLHLTKWGRGDAFIFNPRPVPKNFH